MDIEVTSTFAIKNNAVMNWVLVAHAYNPSYSGGRDQEDQGSKPAWASSSRDPTSKIPNTKRAGGVTQGIGPEFNPSST
jgi:hypothetical protein